VSIVAEGEINRESFCGCCVVVLLDGVGLPLKNLTTSTLIAFDWTTCVDFNFACSVCGT